MQTPNSDWSGISKNDLQSILSTMSDHLIENSKIRGFKLRLSSHSDSSTIVKGLMNRHFATQDFNDVNTRVARQPEKDNEFSVSKGKHNISLW